MSARRLARRSGRRVALLLALVLALACLAAGEALAAEPPPTAAGPTVLLLPLTAEGLADRDRKALEQRVRAAFEHPELVLVSAAEAESCSDDACLRGRGRAAAASHVVRVEVVADGRDFVAQLVVMAVDDDGPANLIDAGCEICGLAEFGDRLAARGVAARDLVLAAPRLGRLELDGQPDHARVQIDGRRRGRVPFAGSLAVGTHELIVRADGYYRELIPIEIHAGVAQQLRVELERKPTVGWWRGLGWGLLGGGLGSLAVGGGLIGAHGSPAALRCRTGEPGLIDGDGDCRWLRRTRGLGLGLAVAGAALVGGGASLLIVDARRRRAQQDRGGVAQVSAGVGLDSAYLQVRF